MSGRNFIYPDNLGKSGALTGIGNGSWKTDGMQGELGAYYDSSSA